MSHSAPTSHPRQILALAASLLVCFGAAAVGGYGSRDAPGFYGALVRPAWAPPAAAFGPVWTLLYALMAVAAWRVWRQPDTVVKDEALGLFLGQLALNALWPWTFFVWHSGRWSTLVIVVLLAAIVLTMRAFRRVDRPAVWLLLPYFSWVAFATALNIALWRANPDRLSLPP